RTQNFVIAVTDANEAPSQPVDIDPADNAVSEAAAPGTVVGLTAAATDPDENAVLTYSLTDDAGGRFVIDSATGVVSVAAGAVFDFETTQAYDIEVTASDGTLSTARTFTIQVTDALEPVGPLDDVDAAANVVAENAAI